jgi:hypothetical protein
MSWVSANLSLPMELTEALYARIEGMRCGAAWEREPKSPASAVSCMECRRALWPLAQDLYAHEPLYKDGVLDRVFEKLQVEQIVRIKLKAVSLNRSRSCSP